MTLGSAQLPKGEFGSNRVQDPANKLCERLKPLTSNLIGFYQSGLRPGRCEMGLAVKRKYTRMPATSRM